MTQPLQPRPNDYMYWIAAITGLPSMDETLISWEKLNPSLREGIIMCTAFLILTALIFIWAAFFRKKFRLRRRSRRHRSRSTVATVVSTNNSRSAGQSESGSQVVTVASHHNGNPPAHRHGRRRRRHRDRPLNPTLSQTGGLPRIRTQAPPDSPF